MAVRVPVRGMKVYLHIAQQRPAIDEEPRQVKIRATQKIPVARRADLQRAAIQQAQPGLFEIAAQPEFLHHVLGNSEGTIKALHFLNLFRLGIHGHKMPHGPATCRLDTVRILPTLRGENSLAAALWKGGRVVYGSCLENRRARKGTVSSNLTPSAIFLSEAERKNALQSLGEGG